MDASTPVEVEARAVDVLRDVDRASCPSGHGCEIYKLDQLLKSLILAQNERWRQGLGMQVARESRKMSTVA